MIQWSGGSTAGLSRQNADGRQSNYVYQCDKRSQGNAAVPRKGGPFPFLLPSGGYAGNSATEVSNCLSLACQSVSRL
jgi:hypothetical protein